MPTEDLRIETSSENGGETLLFRLSGSLDVATSAQMKQALAQAATEGHGDVVVDLTRVEFLDSTGLGALIGAHRRALEAGGRVGLIVKEGPISRLLAITGLSRVFTLYSSLGDALGHIAAVE